MEAVTPATLVERLEWRYAVKRFDPARKIPPATWKALERALVLTASSFGLQPWRFVVVEDPRMREKLLPASWGQRQIVEASHMVVFAARRGLGAADVDHYIARIAEVRGVPAASLEGFRKVMLGFLEKSGAGIDDWSARQTYLAIGNFLAVAALLGVDACPMEGIEPARYDEILGLGAAGYHALAVATAGYRAADDARASLKKVRFIDDEVIARA